MTDIVWAVAVVAIAMVVLVLACLVAWNAADARELKARIDDLAMKHGQLQWHLDKSHATLEGWADKTGKVVGQIDERCLAVAHEAESLKKRIDRINEDVEALQKPTQPPREKKAKKGKKS